MIIPEKYRERYNRLAASHPWMREMRDETVTIGDSIEQRTEKIEKRNHLIAEARNYFKSLADREDLDLQRLRRLCRKAAEIMDSRMERMGIAADGRAIEALDEPTNGIGDETKKYRETTDFSEIPKKPPEAVNEIAANSNVTQECESLSELSGKLSDSREKLEDDLLALIDKWRNYDGNYVFVYGSDMYAQVKNLLDRQAAITRRETLLENPLHNNPYVGLVRGKQWERKESSDYYCGRCGWKVTDHDSYCPECGGAFHKASNKPDSKFDALKTAETPETDAAKDDIRDFDDSRKKLEADIAETIDFWGTAYHDARVRIAIRWLDRQETITRGECAECAESMGAYADRLCDPLKERIDVLTAERDEWRANAEHYGGHVDRLMGSIEKLARKQPMTFDPEAPYESAELVGKYIDELTDERDELKEEIAKYEHDCGLLFDEKHKLTAERDMLMTALKQSQEDCQMWHDQFDAENAAHVGTRQELNRCADVRDKVIDERDRLESQVRQLEGDLKGARKSRDRWRDVTEKHNRALRKLRKQLKTERELARMQPRFDDGAPVRIGDEFWWDHSAHRVGQIMLYERGFRLENEERTCFTQVYSYGEPAERPPLKAADGTELRTRTALDVLFDYKSGSLTAEGALDELRKIENSYDLRQLKPEWLTHEKADSFEEIIDCAEQLTTLVGIGPDEHKSLVERCKKVAERLAKEE